MNKQKRKQTKELVFKLLVLFRLDIFTIQPDLVNQSVATDLYSLIVGSFLQFLCMK